MANQCVAEASVWLMILAILFVHPRLVVILQMMRVDVYFVPAAVYRHLLHYANFQKINGAVGKMTGFGVKSLDGRP